MANIEVNITDNTGEVIRAAHEQIEAALEAVGIQAVTHAQQNITVSGRVDTGTLRNSLEHQVEMGEQAVYIGTNNEYAVYNEMGTGIHLEGGGGRSTPWSYQDARGEWHTTRGMKPIHFLKNAVTDNVPEYRAIIEQHLKG